MNFSELHETIEFTSWDHFYSWQRELSQESTYDDQRWIFRGQADKYELSSTLEREATNSGIPLSEIKEEDVENRLINEFMRVFHQYSANAPSFSDTVEWLALMRHYGAPTRLLDWTYSPFVAAYFAAESAPIGSKCAIWAMASLNYTTAETLAHLGKSLVDDYYEEEVLPRLVKKPAKTKENQTKVFHYLFDHPRPYLIVVNPFSMSERATVQQGIHVMPGEISIPFEENFGYAKSHDNLIKVVITITKHSKRDFLRNLHRMNINRATLFPGLQGFAESLRTRIPHYPDLSV